MTTNSIRMDYPLDPTGNNILYDGKTHDILISEIGVFYIKEEPFYLMRYHDMKLGPDIMCTTVLARVNDTFVKVPLDNYNMLHEYVDGRVRDINLESINIPNRIGLAQSVNVESLLEGNFDIKISSTSPVAFATDGMLPPNPPKEMTNEMLPPNPPKEMINGMLSSNPQKTISDVLVPPNEPNNKNIYEHNICVALNEENNFADRNIFECTTKNDEELSVFGFTKYPNFGSLNNMLKNKLLENPNEVYCDIVVDIPNPTTGYIVEYNVDTHENEKKEVMILPGKHIYHVSFGKSYDYDLWLSMLYSSNITINTEVPNSSSYAEHAFVMGCSGMYDVNCFNNNGNNFRIENGKMISGNGIKR